jgi:hypothetical protein
MKSALSNFLDEVKGTDGEFLLPTPNEGDPLVVEIKIYLFGTPKFLLIKVS